MGNISKAVYYAHSMHLYNTPQEHRDLQLLKHLGFDVFNPNSEKIQEEVNQYKKVYGEDKTMEYFKDLILRCEALCFRSHIDGKIPSGIGWEIKCAREHKMPVFELPNLYNGRFMEVGETKQYLELLGQR